MAKTIIDDGFAPYLVDGAEFDGELEIPKIKNRIYRLPQKMIPFDKRRKCEDKSRTYVHFYIHDICFRQVLTSTKRYLDEIKEFEGIITPDCSLYRDMPLVLQMANTYMNRAVGHYFQNKGINVIPNVRWGDERTYDFCFDGLELGGIYAISTHGCMKKKVEKEYFKKGLRVFLDKLNPNKVIVHGAMPKDVFDEFRDKTEFIHYEADTHRVHRNRKKKTEVQNGSR